MDRQGVSQICRCQCYKRTLRGSVTRSTHGFFVTATAARGHDELFLVFIDSRVNVRTVGHQVNPSDKPRDARNARNVKRQWPSIVQRNLTQEARQWVGNHGSELHSWPRAADKES